MNKYTLLISCILITLPKAMLSQHLPHIHENLIEDYQTFNQAYRFSYKKMTDLGSMEDWAVTQKYKVQLTDSRLVFDQAFDEDVLSKEGLMEYLELLLYQNEFIKYHEILESEMVDRFTEDEIHDYMELSSAWRMIKEQKRYKNKNWIFCAQFDTKDFHDPNNPAVEHTWIVEDRRIKARVYEHCFRSPGVYPITLRGKNLITGYYLPDTTYNYTIDQPMEPEFSSLISSCEIGEKIEFQIAESMKENCEVVWTIGDGTIKIGDKISHQFTVPGTYNVTQYLSYSEHGLDYVKSKSYQIFVNRPEKK